MLNLISVGFEMSYKRSPNIPVKNKKENQKPYNKFLMNLIYSVHTGKHLPHKPRYFISQSVRKPVADPGEGPKGPSLPF